MVRGLGVFNTKPKKPKPKAKRTYRKAKSKLQLVEVTDKAKRIAKSSGLNWPGVEKKLELQFIQHNMNFHQSYFKRLYNLLLQQRALVPPPREVINPKTKKVMLITNTRDTRIVKRVEYLHSMHLQAFEFVTLYLEEVNHTAWNWSGWNGNLLEWILHDEHKFIHKYMARLVADYVGDGSEWTEIHALLKRIKE